LVFVIAAVFAAGIALLVGASAFIPADAVRQAVTSEIRDITGLEPTVRGDVVVSLFPTAMVSFSGVTLNGSHATPALAADRLSAKLALLPLLFGRIEPVDMSLTRPRLAITVEPDGHSNWSALMATLARSLKPGQQSGQLLSFSEIRMAGGTITVTDAQHGISEALSDVELSFAWPSISRSFGATGHFTWRGEAFDASANAADLLAALSGERSGLKLRLAGAPFKLAFEGAMSQSPSFKMEGVLALDGKSLREALRWGSRQPLPGSGFGRFAVKAHAAVTGGTAALSAVNVELDGNVAEGVMALTSEPRLTVKGTLASDSLDITPYLSAIDTLRGNARDWGRETIAVNGLSNFDLDLRLSAARVTMATARFGRTGIAANLRDGKLTLALGEAQAYGGVVKGAFVMSKIENGADIKSQLQFTDVDLESCLGDLFAVRRLEGKGNLSLSLEANGDSVMGLTRTLSGTAELTARQGALAGLNIEQLLKRLEQRPLSIGGDFRRGRTPFDKFNATARIEQGTATIEEMKIDGGAIRLNVGGTASIPARELDLKGSAALVAAAGDTAPAFELPFVVQGSWDDPIVLPDARSLLMRSNAAAPLLDAVRDRKARDTVRSVIDRLNR
jgi:AsmA protein